MADREFKWDREYMNAGRQRMDREKKNLEEQRSVLENLKGEIAANWQSFSSEIYLESLEVDIESLNSLIKAVDEMNGLLKEVVEKAYGECEDKVRQNLRQLHSSISHL